MERFRIEVRRPLIRYALREIRKVRRVINAEDAAKFVAYGKQIVVVAKIGQKLSHRLIRGNCSQNKISRGVEAVVRLHQMRDPAPAGQLLVQQSHNAVVGDRKRDVVALWMVVLGKSVLDHVTPRSVELRTCSV